MVLKKMNHVKKCIVLIADNNQFKSDEYNNIKEIVEEGSDGKIEWEVDRGSADFVNFSVKDVIIIFSSKNMAKCLDDGTPINLKFGEKPEFVLTGENLQNYLDSSNGENKKKVFVVKNINCNEAHFLIDIPPYRKLEANPTDADIYLFIARIQSLGTEVQRYRGTQVHTYFFTRR